MAVIKVRAVVLQGVYVGRFGPLGKVIKSKWPAACYAFYLFLVATTAPLTYFSRGFHKVQYSSTKQEFCCAISNCDVYFSKQKVQTITICKTTDRASCCRSNDFHWLPWHKFQEFDDKLCGQRIHINFAKYSYHIFIVITIRNYIMCANV